ncbi:DNA polymerase Y family protein [Methylobrevis sp. L22]|uniref:DNA-directed DNA polymerase n=2 Tax=Methylobrevis albus TaxID=2793297 RepID=A0A931I0P4_9HYPH|nr:DNA polymerase Y family protein [Methylobrevis albus]
MPADRPLLLLAKQRGALRVVHADGVARGLGLAPGLSLADARARVPDLVVADDDPAADAALLGRLADWCDRFTPLVGRDGADGLMLDVTGCAALFGGEAAMSRDVAARLARAGLTARVAVAGTADAARAVARFGPGGPDGGVVAPGGEAAAVRPLPIAALGLDADRVTALARAGLRSIADLADRPRAPLVARFGADLASRLARTLGEAEHPISPQRPVAALMAERGFPEPVALMDDVLASLASLARRLAERLEEDGLGGRSFEASLFRADGAVHRVAVATSRPLRDPAAVMRLFADRLGSLADPLDPGFGFDMIRLAALAVEPLDPAQQAFGGASGEAEAVADLVDRLGARFGPDRVLRFGAAGSHVPERAYRAVPALAAGAPHRQAPGGWPQLPPGEPPLRPLRLLDPPEPVEAMAEVPDGPPIRFRWRRLIHDVVAAEGPERIAAEWWLVPAGDEGESGGIESAGAGPARDYFRVEDRGGRRFWLFREGLYGAAPLRAARPGRGSDAEQLPGLVAAETRPRWFVHGLFA